VVFMYPVAASCQLHLSMVLVPYKSRCRDLRNETVLAA
jgi:hypothetical protein